jgi:hypothetical protein
MGQQAVLQIDRGERGRQVPQIAGGSADQASELAKDQWVGAMGSSRPGTIRARRSALSRVASTRTSLVSTVRV